MQEQITTGVLGDGGGTVVVGGKEDGVEREDQAGREEGISPTQVPTLPLLTDHQITHPTPITTLPLSHQHTTSPSPLTPSSLPPQPNPTDPPQRTTFAEMSAWDNHSADEESDVEGGDSGVVRHRGTERDEDVVMSDCESDSSSNSSSSKTSTEPDTPHPSSYLSHPTSSKLTRSKLLSLAGTPQPPHLACSACVQRGVTCLRMVENIPVSERPRKRDRGDRGEGVGVRPVGDCLGCREGGRGCDANGRRWRGVYDVEKAEEEVERERRARRKRARREREREGKERDGSEDEDVEEEEDGQDITTIPVKRARSDGKSKRGRPTNSSTSRASSSSSKSRGGSKSSPAKGKHIGEGMDTEGETESEEGEEGDDDPSPGYRGGSKPSTRGKPKRRSRAPNPSSSPAKPRPKSKSSSGKGKQIEEETEDDTESEEEDDQDNPSPGHKGGSKSSTPGQSKPRDRPMKSASSSSKSSPAGAKKRKSRDSVLDFSIVKRWAREGVKVPISRKGVGKHDLYGLKEKVILEARYEDLTGPEKRSRFRIKRRILTDLQGTLQRKPCDQCTSKGHNCIALDMGACLACQMSMKHFSGRCGLVETKGRYLSGRSGLKQTNPMKRKEMAWTGGEVEGLDMSTWVVADEDEDEDEEDESTDEEYQDESEEELPRPAAKKRRLSEPFREEPNEKKQNEKQKQTQKVGLVDTWTSMEFGGGGEGVKRSEGVVVVERKEGSQKSRIEQQFMQATKDMASNSSYDKQPPPSNRSNQPLMQARVQPSPASKIVPASPRPGIVRKPSVVFPGDQVENGYRAGGVGKKKSVTFSESVKERSTRGKTPDDWNGRRASPEPERMALPSSPVSGVKRSRAIRSPSSEEESSTNPVPKKAAITSSGDGASARPFAQPIPRVAYKPAPPPAPPIVTSTPVQPSWMSLKAPTPSMAMRNSSFGAVPQRNGWMGQDRAESNTYAGPSNNDPDYQPDSKDFKRDLGGKRCFSESSSGKFATAPRQTGKGAVYKDNWTPVGGIRKLGPGSGRSGSTGYDKTNKAIEEMKEKKKLGMLGVPTGPRLGLLSPPDSASINGSANGSFRSMDQSMSATPESERWGSPQAVSRATTMIPVSGLSSGAPIVKYLEQMRKSGQNSTTSNSPVDEVSKSVVPKPADSSQSVDARNLMLRRIIFRAAKGRIDELIALVVDLLSQDEDEEAQRASNSLQGWSQSIVETAQDPELPAIVANLESLKGVVDERIEGMLEKAPEGQDEKLWQMYEEVREKFDEVIKICQVKAT